MSKIFFFDIDGTLLDTPSGLIEMSDRNKKAISKLQEDGHLAFIATGRTKCFIVPAIRNYSFSGFVTCNGAYVEYNNQCIYKQSIPQEALDQLIRLSEEFKFDYYIEGYDKIYVNDINSSSVIDFANNWEMELDTLVDDFNTDKIEAYIAMIKLESTENAETIIKMLEPFYDVTRHTHGISFDLNIKGVNKGTGILHLIENLRLDIKDTYAFGDANNDLEMIEVVETGIVMGNGVADLKEIATYITDSVTEDGVASALKMLNFI